MVTIPSSYPDIPRSEALKLTDELCQIFYESGMETDVITLHKAGKQLISLYFDCKNSRFDLSQHLMELQFLEFAVKVMKRLNNIGVFKGDDIWFASFYLYNICWNYSEVNSAFAHGLMKCGIEQLLISNVTHDPYIDNLSKRNVNYLIKATLSITHNILRFPGNRFQFSSDNFLKGLLKIAGKDDKLSVLCTMCLSYIACNDNVESSPGFDIPYNIKLLFYYIKVASESSGKYNGYSLNEFFETLRSASFSKLQKTAIIKFDGLDLMIKQLQSTKEEKVKQEILLTFINLLDEKSNLKIKEIAKYYIDNKSIPISTASRTLSWAIETFEKSSIVNPQSLTGNNIFINFARNDLEIAEKIFEKLTGFNQIPLSSYEDDFEKLKNVYDNSAIIIVCVSESFKGTINFKIGCEYCIWKNKIIFPILVQNNYLAEGWIKDFIIQVSDVCYNFSTGMDDWRKFFDCLKSQLKLLEDEGEKTTIKSNNNLDISQWLLDNNISDLKSKLIDIDMNMLHYMKKIRAEAPDYFFRSLENNLKLNFHEILKLTAALDHL